MLLFTSSALALLSFLAMFLCLSIPTRQAGAAILRLIQRQGSKLAGQCSRSGSCSWSRNWSWSWSRGCSWSRVIMLSDSPIGNYNAFARPVRLTQWQQRSLPHATCRLALSTATPSCTPIWAAVCCLVVITFASHCEAVAARRRSGSALSRVLSLSLWLLPRIC